MRLLFHNITTRRSYLLLIRWSEVSKFMSFTHKGILNILFSRTNRNRNKRRTTTRWNRRKVFFGHWFLSVRGCAVQEVDSVERVIIVLTLEWNANSSFGCCRELNELPINWFTSNVWLKTSGVRVEKLFPFFSRSNVLKLRNFFYRNVNSVNSVSIICPSIFENY